jgi:hypothetical protein
VNLDVGKKREEGQKHGQKGLVVTVEGETSNCHTQRDSGFRELKIEDRSGEK